MSTTKNPRPADVARWVAILAKPEPSPWCVTERAELRREQARASTMLRRRGLDAQGNPKAAGGAS